MSNPEVLVIGGGSAGARHARLLLERNTSVSVFDVDPQRVASIPGVTSADLASERRYDGVVVASPSAVHHEHTRRALQIAPRVLVEKPLATSGHEAQVLAETHSERIMVGYNLRLHDPIVRLVSAIRNGAIGELRSLRLWFGSFLPDWRRTDYRDSYSARAADGGGVLFDAIHELDLALWIAGPELAVVGAVVDRIGALDIDSDDVVAAVLRAGDGVVVQVSLDYLSRQYRRGIEAVGSDATIRLDWARRVLEVEAAGGAVRAEPADTVVEQSYARQADIYLAWVRGEPVDLPVDGAGGAASVLLADAIRSAAR